MKYEWPNKIVIHFLNKKNDVSRLIVYCILSSSLKNNFAMGPLRTNENGEIKLLKEQLLNIIKTEKKEYPMDYSGELNDCYGIKIIIEDKDRLEKRLNRLKHFYPKEAEELKSHLVDSSNSKFLSFEANFNLPFPNKGIIIELSLANNC